MKRCFIPIVFLLILVGTAWTAEAGPPADCPEYVRVMSFNIRYNTSADGKNAWPHRKDIAASMIRFHRADVVGLQEALLGQNRDLAERLPDYEWLGVGREDGKKGGEFSSIFYRKDRLELLQHDTFWLSSTPQKVGSKGWDAVCRRIVTWAKFRDRRTSRVFYHFNTHFDHRGQTARKESAKLMLSRIPQIAGEAPAVVTGDFNCTPDSEPYQILTGSDESEPLIDAFHASIQPHHGPTDTFGGFGPPDTPGDRIDYVFVREGIQVIQHGILADHWDGRYPSDHLPVLAEVEIPSDEKR